jgi:hypothetical protein
MKAITRILATAALAALALAVLVAGPAPASAQAPPAAQPVEGKPIDVVICLDVSGSMQGLIDSARTKLWDIVNDLAKIKPTPKLRVGLYSYGHTNYDPNKGWVRKEVDLTADLDEISLKLFGLTINGGNELVARVCRDAVVDQKWSEDKSALKMIFVAGNEPATQDKQVPLKEVAEKAIAKGIVINPIYCRTQQFPNHQDWQDFATMAGGVFTLIDQNRGVVTINTPHDKELNELGKQLNGTYVFYGKDGKEKQLNQALQDLNAGKQGAGAEAARNATKASGLYRNDTWDLVDRMKNDKNFDLKKVPVEELCDELKKLTPEEREKYVKEMAAKRDGIQKQIAELNVKREAYIKEENKKNASAGDKAFDEAIRAAVKKQAADKGIKVPD